MKAVIATGRVLEMVGAYMTDKIGIQLTQGMYQAFAVVNDKDEFVGAAVLHNYTKHSIELSGASETPMAWRPHVCRAVFKYIFEQLGCVRVTTITTKANKKARKFDEHLGFKLEGNVRLGYDGRRDALVYGMLRAECRFLADDSEGGLGGKRKSVAASRTRSDGDCRSAVEDEPRDGSHAGEPQSDQPVHAAG